MQRQYHSIELARRSRPTDFPGAYQGGPGFSETSLKYTYGKSNCDDRQLRLKQKAVVLKRNCEERKTVEIGLKNAKSYAEWSQTIVDISLLWKNLKWSRVIDFEN